MFLKESKYFCNSRNVKNSKLNDFINRAEKIRDLTIYFRRTIEIKILPPVILGCDGMPRCRAITCMAVGCRQTQRFHQKAVICIFTVLFSTVLTDAVLIFFER